MGWHFVLPAGPLKTDSWAPRPELVRASYRTWPIACALNKNRTGQQKGLRDRNSPTCTLSQNGYGDN